MKVLGRNSLNDAPGAAFHTEPGPALTKDRFFGWVKEKRIFLWHWVVQSTLDQVACVLIDSGPVMPGASVLSSCAWRWGIGWWILTLQVCLLTGNLWLCPSVPLAWLIWKLLSCHWVVRLYCWMCKMHSRAIAGADLRKGQGLRGSRRGEEKTGIIHFSGSLVLDHLKMTVKQYVKCFVRGGPPWDRTWTNK